MKYNNTYILYEEKNDVYKFIYLFVIIECIIIYIESPITIIFSFNFIIISRIELNKIELTDIQVI